MDCSLFQAVANLLVDSTISIRVNYFMEIQHSQAVVDFDNSTAIAAVEGVYDTNCYLSQVRDGSKRYCFSAER